VDVAARPWPWAGELGNGAIAIQAEVTDSDSIVAPPTGGQGRARRYRLVNNAGIMLLVPFNTDGHDDHRRMTIDDHRRMTVNEILVRPTAQP
jgi:hypothetical protein